MTDHSLFTIRWFNRLPLVSIGLLLLLISIFGFSHYLDAERLQLASDRFQKNGLYDAEAPHFVVYLERLVKVDQVADEKRLASAREAFDQSYQTERKQAEVAQAKLTEMILRDRAFYRHLLEDGHVFWLEDQYVFWKAARDKHIEPILSEMLPGRFGLLAGDLSLSDLFTHFLFNDSLLVLVLNALMILGFVMFLEKRVGKARVLLFFMIGGAVSGLLNAVFASDGAIILGSSGASAALLGLYLAFAFDHGFEPQMKYLQVMTRHNLIWVAAVIVLWLCKTAVEFVFASAQSYELVGYMGALIAGAVAYKLFEETVHDLDEESAQSNTRDNDDEFRKGYAKAMDALTRLDFDSAKASLNTLLQQFPDRQELFLHLYRLEKFNPIGTDRWYYALNVLSSATPSQQQKPAEEILEDLRRLHDRSPDKVEEMDGGVLTNLLMIFVKANNMQEAEQVFSFMGLTGDVQLLQEACLVLQQAFKTQGKNDRVEHYRDVLASIQT